MSSVKYSPVSSEDETSGFLQACPRCSRAHIALQSKSRRAASYFLALAPWILTCLFGILTMILFVNQSHDKFRNFGSYEAGFRTDLVLPSEIPLEIIRFTGSPHFDENGTAWRDPVEKSAAWPENMQLFGTPSKEIDDNWEKLIGSRYFSVSEEEAKRAWGEKREEYVDQRLGGYSAGLDMFHTLHCLNTIRKALRQDQYPYTILHGHLHAEHCLDIIRQSIQCSGSTTLIPTKYMDGLQHQYIDSDQLHVCRSFAFLREWVTSRWTGREGYVGRDTTLVDERKHRLALADEKKHFLGQGEGQDGTGP